MNFDFNVLFEVNIVVVVIVGQRPLDECCRRLDLFLAGVLPAARDPDHVVGNRDDEVFHEASLK